MKTSRYFQAQARSIAAVALALIVAGAGLAKAQTANTQPPAPQTAAPGHDGTLYIVGYTHLDTQWCWTMPQVIDEFLPNTLHQNFALFDKYPDYIFNWTGSNRYKLMKEYYPKDYATLKKYVAAGRWYPNGSAVEEGDIDSPSSESLIRQVLYANEFFRHEFGHASTDFMLPDTFGYPASLPTILAHCGIDGFSTQKLTWGSAVGIPFNVGVWVGPDGRGVVSALNPGDYGTQIQDDYSHDPGWIARLRSDGQLTHGVAIDYSYYGTGDRGGAPPESSVQWLEKSVHGDGPVHVISARADQMFNALTPHQIAQLPRYKGDLLLTNHSTGSLTSEAEMKRWNRKNELLADATERAGVAGDWLGAEPYDKARITDAWLRFLPGQFHDLMAGTAIPKAYNYTWNDEVIALNEFAGALRESVGGVARAMDTRARGVAVLVYNPLSIARQDVVEASIAFPGRLPAAVVVYGPDGKVVPSQIDGRDGAKLKVLFLASVPSVGFAMYDVRPSIQPAEQASSLHVTSRSLENARYRVTLDTAGDVSGIYDKAAKRELLSAPARLAYQHENPSQYPAWNMDWDDQKLPPASYVGGPADIKIVESGPVRVALQVTREHLGSRFVQTIRLASGSAGDRVEFATQIDWQGRETALKAVFPLTVSNEYATYNWGIGTVRRASNDSKKFEVPSHEWFDLTSSDGKYGVSILDDCKYGSDKPSANLVRLTLLYTPGTRGGYQHQATQDWGHQEMLYAVVGHKGDWRAGQSQWEGARLNQPLLAFQTPAHAGPLGRSFSLATVSNANVQIEALKQAEDSKKIIVRLNELSGGTEKNVRIHFASAVTSAREVNGQEQPIGSASVLGGDLIATMTPYHPRAFAVVIARPRVSLSAPSSIPLELPYNCSVVSPADGASAEARFAADGAAIPGDLLPRTVSSDGIAFHLAGPSSRNAVACEGQSISLPSGHARRVYLLAAASGGDTPATFLAGRHPVALTIQSWDGYVGQWDNRLWGGVVPELTYDLTNPVVGLQPGYIKRSTIAWYADHRRLASGKNDPYAFCYLFRYGIDVSDGATTLRLPNNPYIKVMAASIVSDPNDATTPAQPLYDTLGYRTSTAPVFSPSGGVFRDAANIAIVHPLYFQGDLRYTLDGYAPNGSSLLYSGPITLTRTTTVKAAFLSGGHLTGRVGEARFVVDDTTPPKVISTAALAQVVTVRFDEPLNPQTAQRTANYRLSPTNSVVSAKLDETARTVLLTLASPLDGENANRLTIDGVTDVSGNKIATSSASFDLAVSRPVISLPEAHDFNGAGGGFSAPSPGLPVHAADPWTMNMYVTVERQPDELTAIAGFGSAQDVTDTQRYLIKFKNCIYFWGSGIDIPTNVPFDIGRRQMITITFDGRNVRIYKDGSLICKNQASFSDAEPVVKLAPDSPWGNGTHFNGTIEGFTIWNRALALEEVSVLESVAPKS